MPYGSGIDLMQWNSHDGPGLFVIAMFGDIASDNETKQFCEVMGIPYIAKPLNLKELFDLLVQKLS
ncbi:MAG: hypothetical protein MK132_07910 [Lentisphaerales bacterium]|nr:hypothetical protein [Lentisphaerales bacterium]